MASNMIGTYVVCPKCEKHYPLAMLSQDERDRVRLTGMCEKCEEEGLNNE